MAQSKPTTVGDLIEQLQNLPMDAEIAIEEGHGGMLTQLAVFLEVKKVRATKERRGKRWESDRATGYCYVIRETQRDGK